MNIDQLDPPPTDMMCRRTPLDLCERFLFLGTTVTISTNCVSILAAAKEAGFLSLDAMEQRPGMRWEIVGTLSSAAPSVNWECNETRDNSSLYLSMGPEQWFAFDLETYEGAGFVMVSDLHRSSDHNAALYMLSVACSIGASLHNELEKSRRNG